jgi:hypothetical protein
MKTPREILLQKHRGAKSKLDALRHEVLRELNGASDESERAPAFALFPKQLWTELFYPARRIWGGLATVWLAILLLNFAMREEDPKLTRHFAPPTAQTIAELKKQQLELTQLLDSTEIESDKPRLGPPRPRSENHLKEIIG